MSNEREILACSLTPPDGSAAAEFEKGLLAKLPDCPLAVELLHLAEGTVAPAAAGKLREHLDDCEACLASFRAFERVLEDDGPLTDAPPTVATPEPEVEPELTLPLTPAAPTPAREWNAAVARVAELFAAGAPAADLFQQTGLTPASVLGALCEARDRSLFEGLFAPGTAAFQALAAAYPQGGEQKSLLELLQARGPCLRNVTVRQSCETAVGPEGKWSWDERTRYFSGQVAPLLVSLLSQASHAGVAWGRTVAAAISGVKRLCELPPPRFRDPLVCVATVGGLVGELKVRAESSSSILASRLAEAINGDWEHLYTLHGLEAFISYLDNSEEIHIHKKRVSRFPNYQAIFGAPGRAGVIDRLDAIITSCGDAHHYNQFWTTELPRLGVSPEKLNRLTYGNIGGVLLEREGLAPADQALCDDIARRWTGITRQHYEQCAQRKPGVIALALGHNKADVVLKCVELGLISELLIDEDLAMALWDKVDPHRLYPRTLEAVLCRQVPLAS